MLNIDALPVCRRCTWHISKFSCSSSLFLSHCIGHDTSARVTACHPLQARKAADLERKKQRGRTAKAGVASEDATSDEQPQQAVGSGTADAGKGSSAVHLEAVAKPEAGQPAQPVDLDRSETQSAAVQKEADSPEGSVLEATSAPIEQQSSSRVGGGSPGLRASSEQQTETDAGAALPRMDGSGAEGTAEQQAEASGRKEKPAASDAQSGTTSSIVLECESSRGKGDMQEGAEAADGPAATEQQDEVESKFSSLWVEPGSTAVESDSVAQQVGTICLPLALTLVADWWQMNGAHTSNAKSAICCIRRQLVMTGKRAMQTCLIWVPYLTSLRQMLSQRLRSSRVRTNICMAHAAAATFHVSVTSAPATAALLIRKQHHHKCPIACQACIDVHAHFLVVTPAKHV